MDKFTVIISCLFSLVLFCILFGVSFVGITGTQNIFIGNSIEIQNKLKESSLVITEFLKYGFIGLLNNDKAINNKIKELADILVDHDADIAKIRFKTDKISVQKGGGIILLGALKEAKRIKNEILHPCNSIDILLNSNKNFKAQTTDLWTSNCLSANKSQDRFAKYFTFSLNNRSNVKITVDSPVDSYLILLKGERITGEVIATDDDSNKNMNPMIQIILNNGLYTVEVTTSSKNKLGSFVFNLHITKQ